MMNEKRALPLLYIFFFFLEFDPKLLNNWRWTQDVARHKRDDEKKGCRFVVGCYVEASHQYNIVL
jgi:hypothetical protein